MDSTTDTDSEAEYPRASSDPARTIRPPSVRSSLTDKCSDVKDVLAALKDLQSVETRLLAKVSGTLIWGDSIKFPRIFHMPIQFEERAAL